jgi:hypothetical protein
LGALGGGDRRARHRNCQDSKKNLALHV